MNATMRMEEIMNNEDSEHWFPAKAYGIGWGFPTKWQGWVVLIVYVLLIIAISQVYPPTVSSNTWLVFCVPLTLALIGICVAKGERPVKWRWGK
ncbi:MAG: hypothetical protein V7754_02705 [Halioglobus sp.]